MPVMADQIAALAVGADSGNVVVGQIYEFATRGGAVLEVAAVTDAIGVRTNLTTGTDILVQEANLVHIKTGGIPITYPDDFIFNDVVASAERITLRFRNTSAAARIVTWEVKVTPL